MIVLIKRLPITQRFRGMLAVGRGVENEMEGFRDGPDPLQGAAQQGGEIS